MSGNLEFPFDPDAFDFGPTRPLSPQPGDDADWMRGYYHLEKNERFATQQAADLHRADVVSWYRLLDAYWRALDVPRITSSDQLWVTEWKIMRLGIVAAKGALDATLAGYYVGAFGDIRQMAEYWFGLAYLELKPSSVDGFYAAPPGEQQMRLPYMGARIREVLKAYGPGGSHANADKERYAQTVNRTYKRMSDGHHLDGLALVQTGDANDPGYYLGATYHPSLAKEAIFHGSLMTIVLGLAATQVMAQQNSQSSQIGDEIMEALQDAIESSESADQDADELATAQ